MTHLLVQAISWATKKTNSRQDKSELSSELKNVLTIMNAVLETLICMTPLQSTGKKTLENGMKSLTFNKKIFFLFIF